MAQEQTEEQTYTDMVKRQTLARARMLEEWAAERAAEEQGEIASEWAVMHTLLRLNRRDIASLLYGSIHRPV